MFCAGVEKVGIPGLSLVYVSQSVAYFLVCSPLWWWKPTNSSRHGKIVNLCVIPACLLLFAFSRAAESAVELRAAALEELDSQHTDAPSDASAGVDWPRTNVEAIINSAIAEVCRPFLCLFLE